ncbi:hypothetical protein [Flavobacterium sp.]|uniref:hypothetical protein n=1 Tax=Flavobacterium sp. TaxID=239 RepID=UPI0025F0F0D1|nr:hypothetical protein [Flavobacterium sp.]
MIEQINRLIAINLQLFCISDNGQLSLKDFKNNEGKELSGARMLAEIMQQKELIKHSATASFTYSITEFGRSICLHGGWEKHLEKLNKLNSAIEEQTTPMLNQQQKVNPMTIVALVIAILITILLCGL